MAEERKALSASRKLLDELLLWAQEDDVVKDQEDAVVEAETENQNRSPQVAFGNQGSGFMIVNGNAPITGNFGAKSS